MDFQRNFGANASIMHLGSEADVAQKQKLNQMSQSETVPENLSGCFDCNICLDSCHDPVVTLCGHLYCWPCIYKWLHVQSTSIESDEQPKCPVCKASISTSSLVPLYGRGRSASESEAKKPQLDLTVPHRPPALGMNALVSAATSISSDSNQRNNRNLFQPENQAFHQQHYFSHPFSSYNSISPPTFGSPTISTSYSPTINMVGEMVFSGMFGNSHASMFSYPNSYPFSRNGSPRLRRHEMRLDKSLNRVSIFLFCCIALCLILF